MECVLRDRRAAQIVADAITFFDGDRYELYAWSVLPNHVHSLLTLLDGHRIDDVVHSWKSYTAKEINRILSLTGPVWQAGYFDHCVRSSDEMQRAVDYIVSNPAAAGLVDWPFVKAYPERIAPLL